MDNVAVVALNSNHRFDQGDQIRGDDCLKDFPAEGPFGHTDKTAGHRRDAQRWGGL